MKELNQYILEKLKVNKESSIKVDKLHSEDFAFVVPYNDAYDEFEENYLDALVKTESGDPDGFIIPVNDAEEYIDKKDIAVYKIPNQYEFLKDFISAYEIGEITLEELEDL